MAPGAVETSPVLSAAALPVKVVKGHEVEPTKAQLAQSAYDAAIKRFVERNPNSADLYQEATGSMPGGNTRTQLHTAPFPVFMKSGKGYQVTSEDGHVYTDLVGELTAAIYGHSHPAITAAIHDVLANVGINLGATIAGEQKHARAMCSRFGIDRIRFSNSGTEANIHALATARAFTGRRRIVVFGGGYHGGIYSFAGGKPAPNCVDAQDFIVAQYNNPTSAREAILRDDVAAVIVEGMQGASGALPGSSEFLLAVQEAANEAGALFILDEVMTSRVAPGGLAATIPGLNPDMKTYGKYLGGGLSFGAFGGREEIMAIYDPRNGKGSLAHHGTFNNNTLSMAVGLVGLTEIYTPEVCEDLNAVGDALRRRLSDLTRGTKMCWTGVGSILCSHFAEAGFDHTDGTIANEDQVQESWTLKDLFYYEMMEAGFWLVRRGSISLILDTPAEELERFVDCVAEFLSRHADILRI